MQYERFAAVPYVPKSCDFCIHDFVWRRIPESLKLRLSAHHPSQFVRRLAEKPPQTRLSPLEAVAAPLLSALRCGGADTCSSGLASVLATKRGHPSQLWLSGAPSCTEIHLRCRPRPGSAVRGATRSPPSEPTGLAC